VGSETIAYPVSLYIVAGENRNELRINEIPEKDQIIENINKDEALEKAFGFIPGQKIKFKSENGETIEWEVVIDYYNNTWLYDEETDSSAFYRKTDNELVFTAFRGDRNGRLFDFYLAAYHVIFTFEDEMQVGDVLPANTFKPGFTKWIQDFIAPFYIFIKPAYNMTYVSKESYFDENKISLQSVVKNRNNKVFKEFSFEVNEKGIIQWTISTGNETIIFSIDK
jgi:hypothetical protein